VNFFKFWIRIIALLWFSQKHLCEISLKCEILWGPVNLIKRKKGNKKQFAKNAVVWFRVSRIYSRRSLSIDASYDSQIHLEALHPPSSWANHLLQAFHWLGFTCFLTIPICLCESSPPFLFACLQCFCILFKICCEDVCLHCVEGCHTNYIHHEFTLGGVQRYFRMRCLFWGRSAWVSTCW
jgi:hypothetical protein